MVAPLMLGLGAVAQGFDAGGQHLLDARVVPDRRPASPPGFAECRRRESNGQAEIAETAAKRLDPVSPALPESTGSPDATYHCLPLLAVQRSEPITVDLLRRKLDAAIVAEAWDAVKAIRERILRAERDEAGNVVALSGRRIQRDA